MTRPQSAALPIASIVLRLLIILNWIGGLAILALLLLIPNRQWIMTSLELAPGLEADRLVFGLRAVAATGLVGILLHWAVLKRLVAIVDTVRDGDAFIPANAVRLKAIAWALLGLQILGLAIAAIARMITTPERPIDLDAGFSISGWLAVLMAFILAGVFSQGTAMRDDLEGTV